MPVEWTIDTERGVARIAFRGDITEDECLRMVREVASVTTVLGDCTLLLDGRELRHMPDYKLVLGVTELADKLRDRARSGHYALISAPGTTIRGKCRQIATVLNTLGIEAELFENETDALVWSSSLNPRLAPAPGDGKNFPI